MCVNMAKYAAGNRYLALIKLPPLQSLQSSLAQVSFNTDSSFFVLSFGGRDYWEQPGTARAHSCNLGLFIRKGDRIVRKAKDQLPFQSLVL